MVFCELTNYCLPQPNLYSGDTSPGVEGVSWMAGFHCKNIFPNVSKFVLLDMAAERNALMERIYPRLKAFAQEKGYEFQVW